MTAAPHPYRQGAQPKKYVLRYWPVRGQLARNLLLVGLLVVGGSVLAYRALRTPTDRLTCTRDDGAATCAVIEELPWQEPRTLWRVEGILETNTAAPVTDDGIPVRLRGVDPSDDTLRFGLVPVTDPEPARWVRTFLATPDASDVVYTTGPQAIGGYAAIVFAVLGLLIIVRLPRAVVFTVDEARGTFTARFGSLFVRHSIQMPLTDIDRVEVTVTEARRRRLQLVRKDGQVELFDPRFRLGEHHHDVADALGAAIAGARHDHV